LFKEGGERERERRREGDGGMRRGKEKEREREGERTAEAFARFFHLDSLFRWISV
jgi:hypothetical protein